MAITPVGTPSSLTGQAVSSLTFDHDGGSGVKRITLVKVVFRNTADIITGITYGGQSLSQLSGSPVWHQDTTGNIAVAFWYKVGSLTGTNSTVVTFSTGTGNNCGAIAESFSGVHQSTPFGTTATNRSGGGNPQTAGSVTVTSNTGQIATGIIGVGQGSTGDGNDISSGDTLVLSLKSGPTDGTGRSIASSRAAGASPNVVLDYTWDDEAQEWAAIGVSLLDAGIEPSVGSAVLTGVAPIMNRGIFTQSMIRGT